MLKSESIKEIAAALSKCQGQMDAAKKESKNPYFKSTYADLASVIAAAKKPLSDNGLSICQIVEDDDATAVVTTLFMHISGEWIEGKIKLRPVKADPQGMGSAITYARRYAYQSMVGLAAEDDDANDASKKDDDDNDTKEKPKTPKPEGNYKQKPIFINRDGCISVDQITALNDLLTERRVSPTKFCESYNRRYGTTIGTINEVTPDKFLECLELLNKK